MESCGNFFPATTTSSRVYAPSAVCTVDLFGNYTLLQYWPFEGLRPHQRLPTWLLLRTRHTTISTSNPPFAITSDADICENIHLRNGRFWESRKSLRRVRSRDCTQRRGGETSARVCHLCQKYDSHWWSNNFTSVSRHETAAQIGRCRRAPQTKSESPKLWETSMPRADLNKHGSWGPSILKAHSRAEMHTRTRPPSLCLLHHPKSLSWIHSCMIRDVLWITIRSKTPASELSCEPEWRTALHDTDTHWKPVIFALVI